MNMMLSLIVIRIMVSMKSDTNYQIRKYINLNLKAHHFYVQVTIKLKALN